MRFGRKINIKITFTILILLGIFLGGVIITAIYDTQSRISDVKNFKPPVALKVLDRQGRLIANVFDNEFRYYAEFSEIPPRAIETLLAVEDTFFFEHGGINFDAISRAMIKNIKNAKLVEGGSTITQQLIKNIAVGSSRTIDRKIKEAILSIQIESAMSKEEILEKYLNFIYFGHGFHGIKTAAKGYFDKDLPNLTLKEMAMLMALPKAPSYYDPVKNLNLSLNRANSILERMHTIGWINKDEYSAAIAEIPRVYDKTLSENLAPYVVDETLRQLAHIRDLKTGGYVVRLNIDLDYQKVAQQALYDGYININKRIYGRMKAKGKEIPEFEEAIDPMTDTLDGAMVVTQSKTGNILALVGGVDYRKNTFNRATQAQRQFGSAVKPFIYQIAYDMGYSQASEIPDVARSFSTGVAKSADEMSAESTADEMSAEQDEEKQWRPKNYSSSLSGIVTLEEALRRSLNLATINLVDTIGFSKIYNSMVDFGFKNVQQDMSIVLGSFVLSPLEAAKQYSMFANYGTMIEPKLIDSVIDPSGKEIYKNPGVEERTITSPQQAFLMIDNLKNVVERGSGSRARVSGIEVAGKTGTSNQNIDAWFSGFSPTLQVVVWYGRNDNLPIGSNESGGIVSAPVFANFFQNILKVEPGLKRVFDIPNGVSKRELHGETYYFTQTSKMPREIKTHTLDEKPIF